MSEEELKKAAKKLRVLQRKLDRSEDDRRILEGIAERNSNLFMNFNAEIESANEQLAEARAAADEANRTKSAFLASMSHEIRTPMNAILGFSDILSGTVRDPQQREYLEAIRTSGNSLLGLINDILDLSKVEAGKLELEFKPCDAASVCRDMSQIFSQKAGEKGIDLTIDVVDGFPDAIVLDELRLRQVLINLIGNAIKFTTTGGVTLRASSIGDGEGSARVTFAVIDTGLGIPEDQVDHIFGAFEQTRGQSAAKFGGTGLGLAISKRLAQMMGGDIRVTSAMGEGSTFFVELAGIGVATQDEVAAQADDEVPAVHFEANSVLVVDDIVYNRMLIRTYLSEYDLKVIEASDGSDGLELAREHKPAVILMDVAMPEIGGVEATQWLRNDDELKETPIIVVTAAAMKEEEEILRQISDAYLKKPVSKAQLVRELMRFLPYDEVIQDPSASAVGSARHWTPADLSEEERAELPELRQLIQDSIEAWQDLKDTLTINDIEIFASRMHEAGHRSGYEPLKVWGERLGTQAKMFDMGSLPATLNEYPVLQNDLDELIDA
ncbi:MAG: response regulator [Gemmatimonadetes bacterium]|nr:response regulator [Gemmatimonadota bacterium]